VQYNIPVAIWFPVQFPKTAPICYVTPVQGMKVKPRHLHVDAQGLIYHPYLHEWSSKSSLIDLIGLLCSVFGKDPPVFADRKSSNFSNQQYQPPNNNANMMQPSLYSSQPVQHVSSMQPMQPSQQIQPMQSMNMVQHSQSLVPNQLSNNQNNINNNSLQSSQNVSSNSSQSQSSQLSTQDMRNKVEVELRKSLQAYYDKENHELNMLAGKQKELDGHKQKITEIKNSILHENQLLKQRKNDLDTKIKAMEQWLEANEKDDIGNIDDVVVPSDTWSKQCMEAVSEDFALSDAMLELDKAIEEEKIQLDVYLKQLRKISREQFIKRALSKEVHKTQDNQVQK